MRILGTQSVVAAAVLSCIFFVVEQAEAAQLLLTAPTQSATVAGTVTLSGNATGYLNVEVHASGTLLGRTTPSADGDFSVQINTSKLTDGPVSLVLNAWNSPAGQPFTLTQQTQLNLDVENSTNTAQLSLSSPAASSTAAGTVTFIGSASGFLNVEVSYAGLLLGRATPQSNGSFAIPVMTAGVPNGARTVLINAWNSAAGLPFTVHQQLSRNLQVANSASVASPALASVSSSARATTSATSTAAANTTTLALSNPQPGASLNGTLIVSGSAPAGYQNVEISYNGILLARALPAADGTFSASISTLSMLDGAQTLSVNAWNAAAGQVATQNVQSQIPVTVANGCLNIVNFGAVGDGQTDNFIPINLAIAAAQTTGRAVCVPGGRFAYSNVLRLTGVKLFGTGNGSVLYALNWADESIFMYGNGVEVRQLLLTGVTAPSRQAAWETTHITLFGATNFVVDHVTIQGSAAAGIQTAQGANHGTISNNTVSNTLADAIHMTDNASYITVEGNRVTEAGDDGIAVVSYASDGATSNHITAINNVVLDNVNGRAMSVVGGANIVYQNNLLQGDAAAACLYFAQESSYNTFGDTNITAEFNSMVDCGNPSIGHGAVMIITTGTGQNTGITLLQNEVAQDGQAGIRVFGTNSNIVIAGNEVSGANPAYDIEDAGVSLTPYVSGLAGYVGAPAAPIP